MIRCACSYSLLNWGTIWYILATPFAVHLGTTAKGLRRLMRISAWMIAVPTVLRIIPETICKEQLNPHALWFFHAAHIINAAACPPISVTVSKVGVTTISAMWAPIASCMFIHLCACVWCGVLQLSCVWFSEQ